MRDNAAGKAGGVKPPPAPLTSDCYQLIGNRQGRIEVVAACAHYSFARGLIARVHSTAKIYFSRPGASPAGSLARALRARRQPPRRSRQTMFCRFALANALPNSRVSGVRSRALPLRGVAEGEQPSDQRRASAQQKFLSEASKKFLARRGHAYSQEASLKQNF